MQPLRTPKKQGLYDPQFEHDACGIAMLAHIKGHKSHAIVTKAITALERMNHRGGRGEEQKAGDGAGMMTELPHRLLSDEWAQQHKQLPETGQYGVGMMFLPQHKETAERCKQSIKSIIAEEGLQLLGWRTVPIDLAALSAQAQQTCPRIQQVFIAPQAEASSDEEQFERSLYQLRKRMEKEIRQHIPQAAEDFYISSLSSRTIVYKGLLLPEQLQAFYQDLRTETYESAFALVHNRFSTNTFPSWRRAQPNRLLLHNGEINTINGNMNWMRAREAHARTPLLPKLEQLRPIIDPSGSDSAMFDNVLELLVMSGWSLSHAMMMMIPEPWHHMQSMDEHKRAFYEYHNSLMEPWDGPAAMIYTDGRQIGACLDRNGLRPARYIVTKDDEIYLSSEVGVVDVPEENIIRKDRLGPGEMLLVDLKQGRLLLDEAIKKQVISARPYRAWVDRTMTSLSDQPTVECTQAAEYHQEDSKLNQPWLVRRQRIFGYTYEEWNKMLMPMALEGHEPTGSMGYDAPLAILSHRPQLLFNYFKQRFAQVTNPPIDAIREQLVTSVEVLLGTEGNLLAPEPEHYTKIRLSSPVLSKTEMQQLRQLPQTHWKSATVPTLFPNRDEGKDLSQALEDLLLQVERLTAEGCKLIILSDRGASEDNIAIPSLLAVSAVHHRLVERGHRTQVSLIVESGEPREVHHFATLIGYGANAVYPYLVCASLPLLAEQSGASLSADDLMHNYKTAVNQGILKIMSKMGISTLRSYSGAQIFEAIGISEGVVERYFPRTSSQIGGLTIEDIGRETWLRHIQAFAAPATELESGSDLQWRSDGEEHLFNPETIHLLQHACRTGDYALYKQYSKRLHSETEVQTTLRGLLQLKLAKEPIPLAEVESVESIMRRFKTGAMSYGSISQEAHEAIAIAMNRIGGKSNSGEGGEDAVRFAPMPNGDSKRSAIKQVASGRFGVNSHYLVHCDEIQIKMAQGAKPGEGGQLAGHKVTLEIARTRGSTPGIELISPPPHHDIYSIEDMAQLIYDLKNANPQARINVKLVAEAGVGTIAAGVAKAKADVILISGYDGGTGAASRTSIKHAGMPWELGLAETHQTLMLNGLRNRVRLEADGKMMHGLDVVMAALLGAEEYGFSTLPLVALGCVMMRVCHLDTCPVGIATQNPELRAKMVGKPEHIVNLMRFIAQEVREYMALLGIRKLDELVGRTDLMQQRSHSYWKLQGIDLSRLLVQVPGPRICQQQQQFGLEASLDYRELLPLEQKVRKTKAPEHAYLSIGNTDRTIGTRLGHAISQRYGASGLPEHTMNLHLRGSAGQSFGAFIPRGITMRLEGEANDGVGKGLSGGTIAVYPDRLSRCRADRQVIIGNAAFYGASAGKAFIRGRAGERFAVRNSGASIVVEGVGDHGCEYMTGGRVVILGDIGKNFAAGMSGGSAYIFHVSRDILLERCNQELVLIQSLSELATDEIQRVRQLISQHEQYTQSTAAKRILQQWEQAMNHFVRIIPRAYKQLMEGGDSNGKNDGVHGVQTPVTYIS